MGKWIFGGLFCGVAAIFMIAGVVMAWRQHSFIGNAEPVKATILKSTVESHTTTSKGRRQTRYTPVIQYEYVVGGQRYQSDRIYPGDLSPADRESAQEVVAKFPAAESFGPERGTAPFANAYYDRRQHSRAFLVKKYDFAPYLFILFPMIHMTIGVAVAGAMSGSKRKPPMMKSPGRWVLPAGMPIGKKFNHAAVATAGWFGVGAAAAGHYFSVADKPYGNFAVIAASIYFALGIIPLAFAVYYFLLKSKVADAIVTTDAYPIRRGHLLEVNVQIDLAGGGRVNSAMIKLACRETYTSTSGGKKSTATRDVWSNEQPFAKPQELMSDRTLSGEVKFVPPIEHPATTPKGTRGYPKYEWELSVKIERPGPDYRATFVVEVV